jgi:hypothetical protein
VSVTSLIKVSANGKRRHFCCKKSSQRCLLPNRPQSLTMNLRQSFSSVRGRLQCTMSNDMRWLRRTCMTRKTFVVYMLTCTCHRLPRGVDPRADHGDCPRWGCNLNEFPGGWRNIRDQSPVVISLPVVNSPPPAYFKLIKRPTYKIS